MQLSKPFLMREGECFTSGGTAGFSKSLAESRDNRGDASQEDVPADSGLMRLQAKNGSERIWFYRNVRYEEPGSPPRVLGHALDVTEQIQAQTF